MKRLLRAFHSILHAGERGDVLLEYVVVCMCIGIAVVKFLQLQFYDIGKGYVGRGRGREIPKAFQRVLEGISLPIP